MATSNNLKRKLKASARRRSRRLADADQRRASEPSQPASERPSVDVGGLIAKTILDYAKAQSQVRDAVVVAALRSCFQGTTPSGDDSRRLSERLAEIPSRYGVQLGDFRKEIDQMLSLAKRQREADHADAFLQLLRTLTQ